MAPRGGVKFGLPPLPQRGRRARLQRSHPVARDALGPPRLPLGDAEPRRPRGVQGPRAAGGRPRRRAARHAAGANAADEAREDAAVSLRHSLLRPRVRTVLAHTRGSRAPPQATERAVRRARSPVSLHRGVVGERADVVRRRQGAHSGVFHPTGGLFGQRPGPAARSQDTGRRGARGRGPSDVGERRPDHLSPNAPRGARVRARVAAYPRMDRPRLRVQAERPRGGTRG